MWQQLMDLLPDLHVGAFELRDLFGLVMAGLGAVLAWRSIQLGKEQKRIGLEQADIAKRQEQLDIEQSKIAKRQAELLEGQNKIFEEQLVLLCHFVEDARRALLADHV
jgi:hypothetical protein